MRPIYFDPASVGVSETIRESFDDLVYKPVWFSIDPNNIHSVVDVGALIGSFTLWALEQWPNAIIHSYEPDLNSYEFLIKNIITSKNEQRVKAFNLAVWKDNEKLQLHQFKDMPGCNSVIYKERPYVTEYKKTVNVNAKSIVNVIDEAGGKVDFLKIDCEGAEYEIIYSLSESKLKKIRYMVIEYHDFEDNPTNNHVELSKFLRSMGFSTQILPTDIRGKMGLGYIYATNLGKANDIANKVFDDMSNRIVTDLEYSEKLKTKLVHLQKEFEERSKWALDLDKLNSEKDKKLVHLQKEFEQSVNTKVHLQKELEKIVNTKEQLQKEFEERSKWALDLDKTNVEKGKIISQLQKELDERSRWALTLDFELTTIKSSLIFNLMQKIARFVDKMAPRDTSRQEFLRLSLESIKLIKNQGFIFFIRAARSKLRYSSFFYRLQNKIKKPSVPKLYLEASDIQYDEIDSSIIKTNKKYELDRKLRSYLKTGMYKITELERKPLISIIILTFNAVELLKSNIQTIESITTYPNYEIIIVTNNLDPNSKMRKFLATVKHKVYLYDKEYSFASVNNFAVEKARGEFLLFLNDDVRVSSPNWLESFVKLGLDEDVGAVGAKLLFPNGWLQEAGGIIWKNGSAWNYGRNKDPKVPEYNFVRDVDYCSGSCLFVRKKIFDKLGGFNTRYKIAYGEDSDLCMSIKKLGLRVLYQPLAEVVHYEGSTQGTDVNKGLKAHQLTNQEIFFEKWQSELSSNLNDSKENSYFESNRKKGMHILYIDHYVPEFDKDAGSVTAFNFVSILSFMGHKVTFWPENLNNSQPYTTELQQRGVEVIYGSCDFEEFIKERKHLYSVCIMARPYVSINFIDKIKKYAPHCKIIYEPSDLHYVRMFRESNLNNDSNKMADAQKSKEMELALMKKSDLTLFRTEKECQIILREDPSLRVAALTSYFFEGESKPINERKDIVFIGGFGHPPNVDAVEYFVNEIFPLIRQKMPEVKFYVVGSNIPDKLAKLCKETKNCILVGYVEDVSDYLSGCRIMVVPLRWGAGVKGKIIHSMWYSLPVVTTEVGAEGIPDKENVVMISDKPEEFANNVVTLYNNQDLWEKYSRNMKDFAETHYSPEATREIFKAIFKTILEK